MIEVVGIGALFVAVAAVLVAGSVRLGILVGLRLDRAIEARSCAEGDVKPELDDKVGREENRGE